MSIVFVPSAPTHRTTAAAAFATTTTTTRTTTTIRWRMRLGVSD